jgi:transcriptional antiterminator RfaH
VATPNLAHIVAKKWECAGVTVEHWYLVQVKPNSYRLAKRNLVRQGFTCFQPLLRTTERRGAQFRRVSRPLFPGYLFLAFDPARAPWRKINSTAGVARLLSLGNKPQGVPEGLVADLQARLDAEGHVILSDALIVGDRVEIQSGPFAGFIAEVAQLAPEARAHLLIDLMGRQVQVTAQVTELRKS